mmetsp:Transcript_45645/g.145691  ORF Transcript_45645/g.145691 Transcript_45645/m.145691 type:complete len:496 (+) Transcript_45645:115-1602(+)
MGNARSSSESLVYFRAWTVVEVDEAQKTLRSRRGLLAVDRATFNEIVGVQNREALRVFDALDSDYDGKVDTFEVLLTLTLWSCASWEEKQELLFRCFDFNQKGSLQFRELAFLVSTAARATGRFALLPAWAEDPRALRDTALTAYGDVQEGELAAEDFARWFEASEAAQQLRDFVDLQLSQEAPEAVEGLVRERLRLLEYRVQELAQEVQQFRANATAIHGEAVARDELKGQHADALWERLEGLFVRLASAGESQKSELQELALSMNEEVSAGGPAALLQPEVRYRHGQLMAGIDALERRARGYLEEAKAALGELLELAGAEGTPETPAAPAVPAPGSGDEPEALARRLRLLDRELRRRRGKQLAGSGSPEPAPGTEATAAPSTQPATATPESAAPGPAAASEAPQPGSTAGEPELEQQDAEEPLSVVVAFAAFDPPESSETLMLTLKPGDEIVALGQDGQGWWFGRKADGTEGWFPPAYVQLKHEATVSQANDR